MACRHNSKRRALHKAGCREGVLGWCQCQGSVVRGPGQRKYLTMVNTVGDTTARARLLLCALLLTAAMRVAEAGVVTLDGVELNGYNSHI